MSSPTRRRWRISGRPMRRGRAGTSCAASMLSEPSARNPRSGRLRARRRPTRGSGDPTGPSREYRRGGCRISHRAIDSEPAANGKRTAEGADRRVLRPSRNLSHSVSDRRRRQRGPCSQDRARTGCVPVNAAQGALVQRPPREVRHVGECGERVDHREADRVGPVDESRPSESGGLASRCAAGVPGWLDKTPGLRREPRCHRGVTGPVRMQVGRMD